MDECVGDAPVMEPRIDDEEEIEEGREEREGREGEQDV